MVAVDNLIVMDGVLENPQAYREHCLSLEYRDYDFGHCIFRGIGLGIVCTELMAKIKDINASLQPTLTFVRKSPKGQAEPNYIHTDIDMGEWSALLYLNPNPPAEDGTTFYTHKETGTIGSFVPHERSIEGHHPELWEVREKVDAKFNRLLMFPSHYFHSRAIFDNWGEDTNARLVQVTFGKGVL